MEILETKGRKMNKIKREEREDLHTFSDTTKKVVFAIQKSGFCNLKRVFFADPKGVFCRSKR